MSIDFEKLSNVDLAEFKVGDKFLCVYYSRPRSYIEHKLYAMTRHSIYPRDVWDVKSKEYVVKTQHDINLTSSDNQTLDMYGDTKPVVLTVYSRTKKRLWGEYIRAVIPLSHLDTEGEDMFMAELSGDWTKISKKLKTEFIRWKNNHA